MTGAAATGGPGAEPAPWPSRLRAAGHDALVIGGGVAALAVVGFGLRALGPGSQAPSVQMADVAGLGLLVGPTWLYLTLGESGRAHGTWGKRHAGLQLTTATGVPAGPGRVAIRNLVKLLPWQLAHIAAARLLLDVDAPVTIAVADAAALLLPAVSVALALRDPWRRGLHDRLAGTRVTTRPRERETTPPPRDPRSTATAQARTRSRRRGNG